MRPFSKNELIATSIILILIALVSFRNFQISLRRARDAQRKADIGSISNGIHKYSEDFGFFPPSSEDGRIIACKRDEKISLEDVDENLPLEEKLKIVFRPCNWGEDPLRDATDLEYPAYIDKLPVDPNFDEGRTYRYISNLKRFQLYASLEGEDEAEYDVEIVERGLSCGEYICNFGRSSGATPLDKSIEEYENELRQKEK